MKLFIDLDRCRACAGCVAPCTCLEHPGNDGISRLREAAEFAVTCRRCEVPPCVEGCPSKAMERRPDGTVLRRDDLCVSCLTCCFTCPFGVILPDLVRRPASC